MQSDRPPSLLDWVSEQAGEEFPPHEGRPYVDRLKSVACHLNTMVHPNVGKGAMSAAGGGEHLTDHGPQHIQTVMRRASSLLSHPAENFPQITAYEAYLLLTAIHFHDVGNILGRVDHESKLAEVMEKLYTHTGEEMVERQAICKIAGVHSGKIEGSRDTISTLPREELVRSHRVRYQALAALLRFADELADESHRADRTAEVLGLLPAESEIYHAYARSLHSVGVMPEQSLVDLKYSFVKEDALRTFRKRISEDSVEEVYLLDEIFSRTVKMHFEREYCMRFTRGIVHIEAISVSIEVFADRHSIAPCVEPIGFRLQERGYPGAEGVSIVDICPDLTLTGEALSCQLGSGE